MTFLLAGEDLVHRAGWISSARTRRTTGALEAALVADGRPSGARSVPAAAEPSPARS